MNAPRSRGFFVVPLVSRASRQLLDFFLLVVRGVSGQGVGGV